MDDLFWGQVLQVDISPRMSRLIRSLLACSLIPVCLAAFLGMAETPEVITLGNGSFQMQVTMPMTRCISEYGPRFDISAAITSVKLDGNEFLINEGLIDEFNIAWIPPPGYSEAKPGETFLKIGVGEVIREEEKNYEFWRKYKLRQPASTSFVRQEGGLAFTQSILLESGWGYEYRKSYAIHPESRTITVAYSLQNIGQHTIEASQYTHNWFALGGFSKETPPCVIPDFGFTEPPPAWLSLANGRLTLARKPAPGDYFTATRLADASKNRMQVVNLEKNQSVTVSGDFEVSRFSLSVNRSALCPEIFIHITLSPGQIKTWSRTYEFSNTETQPSRP